MDSMLGFRAITLLVRLIQAPQVVRVAFEDSQGNLIGALAPYEPSPYASMVEVPVDARVRIVLKDPDGVDPATVRIQLNREVFLAGDPSIETTVSGKHGEQLEILFTPPELLPPASIVSLQFQAGDRSLVTDPPPSHARFMRDERIVFTTKGFGEADLYRIGNRGDEDTRFQPPPISFALRGSATTGGKVLAAHHFALLDTNTSHKHTVLFVHKPTEGNPHMILGWAGVIFGFSGMNSDGLVYTVNPSDTLDNPLAGEFLKHLFNARLVSSGVPIGIMGRELLTTRRSVEEAMEYLKHQKSTFGWNVLLVDRAGSMAAVELDSNILGQRDGGFHSYTPDTTNPANLDPWGRPWASVGPDDLCMASHFQANSQDIELTILGFPLLRPQRFWTSFYFRSLRAFYILGDEIEAAYGQLDVAKVIQILSIPELVDQRDSMNAAVYEPEDLKVHFAMGQVPATSGPFLEFDLGAARGEGAAQ
jgi:hypothetical protein